MIDDEALRKTALFDTIPETAVFCSDNVEIVYQALLIIDKQSVGDYIYRRLCLFYTIFLE
jgi:CTP synthase (UTP-ammonia lyase)